MQITRVEKMNKKNKRPRIIVVKLQSPRQRDKLLDKVNNFNKKRNKKISNNTPVFAAKHLTSSYKLLHAAARKKAKDMPCSFVWVRSGRVYMWND